MLFTFMSPMRAMRIPDPVAFTAFGRDVYWYGVLMAVGVICAFFFASREVKRKKLHPDTAFDICLICVPLGVVFARLYYVLFNYAQYRQNPVSILFVWEGGLAIYGAVIGGILGLLIYARAKKVRFLTLADVCAPGLVLAQAIGRWGNFINQEAYGIEVVNPNHMWFPMAVLIERTDTVHYATFFYESAWCFIVFLLLWFVLRKRVRHDGDVFLWYAFLYGFERMFVEGLRTDSLYAFGSIRVSQMLSAAVFAAVGLFFLVRMCRERRLGDLIWPSMPAPGAETVEMPQASAAAACESAGETAEEPDCESTGETAEPDGEAPCDEPASGLAGEEPTETERNAEESAQNGETSVK